MLENSRSPLLHNKKTKSWFPFSKTVAFLAIACASLFVAACVRTKAQSTDAEVFVSDVDAYRHTEDSVASAWEEVESDSLEEVEVGAETAIEKATRLEAPLCEQLRTFTADLSDLQEKKPRFGEELEYHNSKVSLNNGKNFYTKNGKESGAEADWGYTTILGYINHKDLGKMITIEGETGSRVEAFTEAVSTDDKDLWLCQYELLAALRRSQGKSITLEDSIKTVFDKLSTSSKCKPYIDESKLAIDYKLNNEGGTAAYNVESVVSQMNFGAPISLFDPFTVGSAHKDNYDENTKRHKFYKKKIPKSLEGLWPLKQLSRQVNRGDLHKLQLIPDPIVRSLVTLWREIYLTLLKKETDGGKDDYWKKKDFKLFPKHKFTGAEKIFTDASKAYDILFPTPEQKYAKGHMFKKGNPNTAKPKEQWSDYGSTLRKNPWEGIRGNYADPGDKKSIEVVKFDGQPYIVLETRDKGPDTSIVSILPSTKLTDTNFEDSMGNFLTAMKEIQSFKSNVQSRCEENPGKPKELH